MDGGMWTLVQGGAPWLAGGIFLLLILLLFHKPLNVLGRFLLRTIFGIGALALFAPVGQLLGITLGVNLWNGLILGALGIPGFGLLLMLHWVIP